MRQDQQHYLNAPRKGVVVTTAVLRAAEALGLTAKATAAILGVSEATVSRMKSGQVVLEDGSKAYELAVLLIRLFRSLDAVVGGDLQVAQQWLRCPNLALNTTPLESLSTITGLMNVVAYLDSRRAPL